MTLALPEAERIVAEAEARDAEVEAAREAIAQAERDARASAALSQAQAAVDAIDTRGIPETARRNRQIR